VGYQFRRVDRCAFCANRADSREHAWADWAIERFYAPGNKIVGEVGTRPFIADPLQKSLRVRCVCIPCNTGWMKKLQDAVIPFAGLLMQDVALELDMDQQWILAQWAMMTAMVFEYTNDTRDLFYTDDTRATLRTRGALPDNTSMFVARNTGDETFFTLANEFRSDQPHSQLRGYITTMAYKALVIQVVTIERLCASGDNSILHIDGDEPKWQGTFTRFWPVKRVIRWPGPMSIAPAAIRHFHHRFDARV
jgi:hypothetical protein